MPILITASTVRVALHEGRDALHEKQPAEQQQGDAEKGEGEIIDVSGAGRGGAADGGIGKGGAGGYPCGVNKIGSKHGRWFSRGKRGRQDNGKAWYAARRVMR